MTPKEKNEVRLALQAVRLAWLALTDENVPPADIFMVVEYTLRKVNSARKHLEKISK